MIQKPLFTPLRRGVYALLVMSIFQSAFVLEYPRDPHSPVPTPVKSFNVPPNSPALTQQSKSKILSPAVSPVEPNRASCNHSSFSARTPQKQKPFNPTSSTLSTSAYLTSPLLTPSRTLSYKFPTASSFNDWTNSSMSGSTSVPPSPSSLLRSSPLMAFQGKHSLRVGSEHHVHPDGTDGWYPRNALPGP